LSDHGIGFRSLQENMDTTTSGGKLDFHIFGALAEFEREVIRERTNAELQAAQARRLGGRPTMQLSAAAARLSWMLRYSRSSCRTHRQAS